MNLKEYFGSQHGIGVLSTADAQGRVDAGVPARLAAIDRTRRHAALATDAGGVPYLSLVAFALAPDGAAVLFATPRDSRKYRNLRANPRVSLLLDTRGERDRDYGSAEAITVVGRARVLRAGSSPCREAERALHTKQPSGRRDLRRCRSAYRP